MQLDRKNLHAYQEKSVDHILENNFCGLLLEMGLGKTVSTLTAINCLIYEELEIDNILVIAPKRVVESVWGPEINKWNHLNKLTITRIIGTEKQRQHAMREKTNIHLISRDNIAWLIGQFGGSMLPYDMLVVDESSSFKNPKSIRFKALRSVQPSFKRIVILTGTPAPNGLGDLWSQIYLLDRGERLGKFITKYRKEYFSEGQRNGHIVYNYNILSDGEKRIYEKIEDICISMKAEDYLNVPKRINNYIEIKLTKKIQKQYDEFEKEKVLELIASQDPEKPISAVNAAALSTKLLQFANGAIYDEDRNYHVVHDAKIEATVELVEQAQGKPVLIAWTYRHDLYRLQEKLSKYKPRVLKTNKDIENWNSGKIQIMMMHPASGGHGLNLQSGGSIIIWFGQTWSLELYQQFNARLHRQGQTEITVVNHLVCLNTLDTRVIKSLDNKTGEQENLIQAIKSKIKKYEKNR